MYIWLWSGFILLVLGLLALDLGVFHKKNQVITSKDVLLWTGFWIALAFGAFIYIVYANNLFNINW